MDHSRLVPPLVRAYLERAVPAGAGVPERIRITQQGEMRQKPDGRWLPFRAAQEFAVGRVAFAWRARFPIAPGVWLRVVDGYDDGNGRLDARLWGLVPVMRSRGADVAKGQLMRYLAELAWTPHAMLANDKLSWRELDGTCVEVVTCVGPEVVSVRLEFSVAGDIVRAAADARPRAEGGAVPWAGSFYDYATIGGIRIPRRAEVSWLLPEGPFTYFRCTVTSLEAIAGPSR